MSRHEDDDRGASDAGSDVPQSERASRDHAPAVTHVPIDEELDLHAFAARDVRSVVEEYVTAAAESGRTLVRLVHGRGHGVQRGIVQATLEAHPLVVEFWDDTHAHLGATIARLTRVAATAADLRS
jgi:DNA-nicking Smr family endonuclease